MKFFKDKSGKVVIAQWPNLPLWFALFFFILEKFSTGILEIIGASGLFASLVVWSYMEITSGVNGFRRFFGVVVMFLQVYKLLKIFL
jgi:hypothetical protein